MQWLLSPLESFLYILNIDHFEGFVGWCLWVDEGEWLVIKFWCLFGRSELLSLFVVDFLGGILVSEGIQLITLAPLTFLIFFFGYLFLWHIKDNDPTCLSWLLHWYLACRYLFSIYILQILVIHLFLDCLDKLLRTVQKFQYLLQTFLLAQFLLLQATAYNINELSVLFGFSLEIIRPDNISSECWFVVRLIILLISKLV